MTLHVMTPEHLDFVAQCYMNGGASYRDAYDRAHETMEVAMGYYDPIYFVGPSADDPRYFIGAYLDVNGRSFLTVGTTGFMGASMYRDAMDWLAYMLKELNVKLIEAYVWVADLQKEWFLRAVGFQKSGVIPDKIDVPGKGPQTALSMYIRPVEFAGVTRESFRDTLKRYRQHRDKLKAKRAAG